MREVGSKRRHPNPNISQEFNPVPIPTNKREIMIDQGADGSNVFPNH